MLRKIITIDDNKCDGCGLCVSACHEGAIALKKRKAVLIREDFCDGLGDCLPACPRDAIQMEQREAPAYDEAAVKASQKKSAPTHCCAPPSSGKAQWPLKLRLIPGNASFLKKKEWILAADCTAFARGGLKDMDQQEKAILIACPKLDAQDYANKLTELFAWNTPQKVTILRMHVPCCAGLQRVAQSAVAASGKHIVLETITLNAEGEQLSSQTI